MGNRGGARPGAGRKPRIERLAGAINQAENKIADRLPDLLDWLFTLAEGVEIQEPAGDGAAKVYTRPPDLRAIIYLINRVMGKPTERVETAVDNDPQPWLSPEFERALAQAYGTAGDSMLEGVDVTLLSDAELLAIVKATGVTKAEYEEFQASQRKPLVGQLPGTNGTA